LEVKAAKEKLMIKGEFDPETVKAAYFDRVKEVRGEEDFETLLLELNVARDTLLGNHSNSRELVPVLAKELATISAKQNELMQINDAKDEIRETFGSVERRSINRIKGTRDITGLLSAASAALAFGKDNLPEFLPSLTDATLFSQTLLLWSASLAFLAFMANRRAGEVSSRMDEINRNLTRDRQISRLLLHVFRDDQSLTEIEFEARLQDEISASTGVRNRSSALDRVLELYGSIGFPVPIKIHFGRDFVDDYIDYLTKSGHVNATGVSGHDMTFHRAK
jgi:hypothetical protein